MNEMNHKFGASRKMLGLKKERQSFAVLSVMALTGFVLTIVSLSLLMVSKSYADQTVLTQTAVMVTSSCEMTSVVDTAHEATVTASTYEDEIGETTITVACNDTNGYAIYAVGFTNNEFGRNDMLGQTSGRLINTGTAVSGETSGWAMKLTPVDNSVRPTIATGYDDYHTVPDTYTKVVSYVDSTMTNASGSQFKTTYATYVASLQTPDTYVGKVKYTLVHPADTTNTPCGDTYIIVYNRNGGTGSMESQTACVDRAIGLLPNGFTAPELVTESQFAAWNTELDGSGYTYYAGQSVANLASAGETVTLYAQWVPKYIQDFTGTTCQKVASERPFTVYDRRDGSDYTVRYIEGACWMTQNLRITGIINSQYSNFSTYDNINLCDGDVTSGNSYDYVRCHNSNNNSKGVWYNYAAVSANTIIGSSNDETAIEDICPANWHIPNYDEANTAGSVNSLSSTSSVSVLSFAPVIGGRYYKGSIGFTDSGYWWSATASSVTGRYVLSYNGTSLGTGDYNRGDGRYVRCVRKSNTINEVSYMQDVTSEMVENMGEGDTAILMDRRDDNAYTVAKIQGALWMTQNLRITGVVSSQYSNFSTYGSVNVCEGDLTSGDSTTELRCHVPEEIEDGVWYNFASASAKTITGSSSAVAVEDICPAGWQLPGYDANNSPGSINSLTSTSAVSATMFLPEVGGFYRSGLLRNASSQGVWWQSAPNGGGSWSLNYFNSNNSLAIDYGLRSDGYRIRCVHL